MLTIIRNFLVSAIFISLSVGQSQAALLSLNYSGLAVAPSTLPGGVPVTVGTPFEIHAIFSAAPNFSSPGIGLYGDFTEISISVGAAIYSSPATDLGNYGLTLVDPSSSYNRYIPALSYNSSGGFGPNYSAATPLLDATNATPTIFSGYQGYQGNGNQMLFSTTEGTLTLAYDGAVGINSSITSVPIPPAFWLMGSALAGLLSIRHRRKP